MTQFSTKEEEEVEEVDVRAFIWGGGGGGSAAGTSTCAFEHMDASDLRCGV